MAQQNMQQTQAELTCDKLAENKEVKVYDAAPLFRLSRKGRPLIQSKAVQNIADKPRINKFVAKSSIVGEKVLTKRQKQKPARRRILVELPEFVPAHIMRNLPYGIKYTGTADLENDGMIKLHDQKIYENDDQTPDLVRLGEFLIDIIKVSRNDLKYMRSYWPLESYKMVKNRKTARVCRQNKKIERLDAAKAFKDLANENIQLKAYIMEMEKAFLTPQQQFMTIAQKIEILYKTLGKQQTWIKSPSTEMQNNQFNLVSTKLEDLAKVVGNDLDILELNTQYLIPINEEVQNLDSIVQEQQSEKFSSIKQVNSVRPQYDESLDFTAEFPNFPSLHNKAKTRDFYEYSFPSKRPKLVTDASKIISYQNIIDRQFSNFYQELQQSAQMSMQQMLYDIGQVQLLPEDFIVVKPTNQTMQKKEQLNETEESLVPFEHLPIPASISNRINPQNSEL